jgi:hypothetical protein
MSDKSEEPKSVPPHPRLRKPRKGSKDYASEWHTESEHKSHGQGSYRKLHKRPQSD